MLVTSCHVIMCSCCGSHVLQQVLINEGNLELRAAGAKHLAFVLAQRSALASSIIKTPMYCWTAHYSKSDLNAAGFKQA